MLINAQTIVLAAGIYAGLSVCSLDNMTLANAEFDDANVMQISLDREQVIRDADFYVAVDGSDSAPGSLQQPFATLDKASRAAQPGDLVYVRGGTYSIDVELTTNGTSNKPITYESYPNELAIFDGSHITPGNNKQFVVNTDWNIVRNIEVRNSPMRGILVLGDDNIIENVRVHDNNHAGLQFFETARNQALNVESFNNYDLQTNGGKADGIQALNSRDTTIRGCRVYNNSDDGVDNYRSVGMIIADCIAYHNGYNDGDGNGFKLGGSTEDSGSATVMNSIAFENKRRGFTYNGSNLPSTLTNNTSSGNPVNYQFLNVRHVLLNNISFQGDLDLDKHTDDRNNSWNLNINDPQFISTDPASGNFLQPETDSPAMKAGIGSGSSGVIDIDESAQ